MDAYTIGQAAEKAHVTVRTLHHYDRIGLLPPSGRSSGGYRLYSRADMRRLREIVFYRELAFGLEEIRTILADPDARPDDHLRRQHGLLREQIARSRTLLGAIEKEMEALSMGISLTPEEQFEIFGIDKLDEYDDEAAQRWGETEAWKESQKRTVAYTKETWITIKHEADANIRGFAAALAEGQHPTGTVAMGLAEEHRLHLSRWFYDCNYAKHRGLAAMFTSDPRFTANYDETAPGLAQYVHDAILANADRAEG